MNISVIVTAKLEPSPLAESPEDTMTLRERLSHRLHMWATRIHDDFHTHEITTPQGEVVEFSCYWQWAGHWPIEWAERCSCDHEDLR